MMESLNLPSNSAPMARIVLRRTWSRVLVSTRLGMLRVLREANHLDVHRTTPCWDIAQPTRRRRSDVSLVARAAWRSRGLFRRTGCECGFDRKRPSLVGIGPAAAYTVFELCR
jgi:hypothetical protein